MTDVYKRLGAISPTATTNTALYVVPSSIVTSSLVSSINVCNRNNASVVFRMAHIDGAVGALAVEDYIYYDVTLTAYDTFEITRGITMAPNDTIMVYCDTANVSFIAWGSETS
jgi:hypothetical protein